jgi:AI-2 transport protein TqsA
MTEPSSHDVVGGESTVIPRGLVVVLGLMGLLVSTLAMRQFASILAPVLLALVLVIGVHPLTGILRRRGLPQWLAATITLLVILAIIIGLAAALALSVARLGTTLPEYQAQFQQLLNELKAWLAGLGVGPDQIQAALLQIDFGKLAGLVTGLLSGLANVFTNLLFLIFVVIFMGIDAAGFSFRMERVGTMRTNVVTAISGFVSGTRSYLIVSTIFGMIVAALDTLFLWIAGVPLALLWGLLSFVTNYIPNIGFIIQSLIQPKFVSDAVNLSLTLTFLSLVFWSFVIGPLGAVLAVPLTLLAKALLLDVDPRTQWLSTFLSGGPPESAAEPSLAMSPDPAEPSSELAATQPPTRGATS